MRNRELKHAIDQAKRAQLSLEVLEWEAEGWDEWFLSLPLDPGGRVNSKVGRRASPREAGYHTRASVGHHRAQVKSVAVTSRNPRSKP